MTDILTKGEIFHHFQPIYNLNNFTKLGDEALIRSKSYPNPEAIFQVAKDGNQLFELDTDSLQTAASTYYSTESDANGTLFLNILPSTISNPSFPSLLEQFSTNSYLKSKNIVLEISESELVNNFITFKDQVTELKRQGFLIAIDDVGKGHADVKSIIELEPDYLKLDQYLSRDLHLSKEKQSFVSFFINYCEQNGKKLILEGIEKNVELRVAKLLGVSIGQGFLLGKPTMLKNQ